jgi:hypothetical protein
MMRLRGATIPAAVANPVVGTQLTEVYLLPNGGVGPRTGFPNGTCTSASLNAYLIAEGWASAPSSRIYLTCGAGTKTIEGVNFSGCPAIILAGTGTINFVDCKFDNVGDVQNVDVTSILHPVLDANGTLNTTTGTLVVNYSYCEFNYSNGYVGSGTANVSRCRFRNQKQTIYDVTTGSVNVDWSWISGGGCNPARNVGHVELTQGNTGASNTVNYTNTLITLSDGQAALQSWNSAWTGVWSVYTPTASLVNCIVMGVSQVNANGRNPNMIATLYKYGTTVALTITNCVLDAGYAGSTTGYSQNDTAMDPNRPTVSNNRSLANVALTGANFS